MVSFNNRLERPTNSFVKYPSPVWNNQLLVSSSTGSLELPSSYSPRKLTRTIRSVNLLVYIYYFKIIYVVILRIVLALDKLHKIISLFIFIINRRQFSPKEIIPDCRNMDTKICAIVGKEN